MIAKGRRSRFNNLKARVRLLLLLRFDMRVKKEEEK